jgi:hypothetical protein
MKLRLIPRLWRAAAALALGLLLALPLAGQDDEAERDYLDPVRLQLIPLREAPSWLLRTLTDAASISWHLDLPEGRTAESSLAALISGGSLFLISPEGRLADPGPLAPELWKLAEEARGRAQSPESRVRHTEGPSPYYFPGWTALDFSWAAGSLSAGLGPLPGEGKALELVLPSAALLDPKEPAEILIVLKMRDKEGVEALLILADAEYFAGEREFFTKTPAYAAVDYRKKALAFFGLDFEAGAGLEVFQKACAATYPDLVMLPSDWTLFEGDPDSAPLKHRFLTHFLNTMLGASENVEDVKIFTGGDTPTWFEAMYGVNRIPEISAYLRYCYDAALPLFVSPIEEIDPDYDYRDYAPVSADEGRALARAAMRYYSWGVDYQGAEGSGKGGRAAAEPSISGLRSIAAWTSENKGDARLNYAPSVRPLALSTLSGADGLPQGWARGLDLDSPFAEGRAGRPLPYARDGMDSPRSFAQAMGLASKGRTSTTGVLVPEGSGVDALGFLTGALAQTGLVARIRALDESQPALAFDSYYKTGKGREGLSTLSPGDLEKVSLLVPDLRELRAGDLLVHYGANAEAMRIAIVLYAPPSPPAPGSDPRAFLEQVVVVGIGKGDSQVRLCTWTSSVPGQGLSPTGSGFQVRRVLASLPSSSKGRTP